MPSPCYEHRSPLTPLFDKTNTVHIQCQQQLMPDKHSGHNLFLIQQGTFNC